jgi:hypothetical protein
LAHQASDRRRENGELECALGLVSRLRDGGNVCEHENFAAAAQAGSKHVRELGVTVREQSSHTGLRMWLWPLRAGPSHTGFDLEENSGGWLLSISLR